MNYETILFEQKGEVVWITLNRPEKLNALTPTMFQELITVFDNMAEDKTVKVAVIKGAGRACCAGHDLGITTRRVQKEQPNKDIAAAVYHEQWAHDRGLLRQCADVIWKSPVITIAQIHGYCVAGGVELLMVSDLVIAAEDARIVWRPLGGAGLQSHLWPWTIGLRKTKELLFTAEYVTGKEAAEMGMINQSVPAESLDDTVNNLAKKIATKHREFLYMDKLTTNKAFDAMGLWNSWDYSIAMHVISHLVEPSKEMNSVVTDRSAKEVIAFLNKRVSPYDRERES